MSAPSQRLDLDLGPSGPLDRVERAFHLARAGGLRAVIVAWFAASLPALAWLFAFYIDAVEGVTAFRPLSAIMLVLSFWARTLLVVPATREYVQLLSSAVTIDARAGRPLRVFNAASIVAVGLTFWSLLFGVAAWGGVIAVLLVAPISSLRGAWAPSWIARVSARDQGGWSAMRDALRDGDGQRGECVAVESLMHAAYLATFVNVGLTIAVGLMMSRSLLGLELALVDEFLSLRNGFVVLAISLGTIVLFEPIRLALSAIAFVQAALSHEGLGIRIAMGQVIARTTKAKGRYLGALAILASLTLPGTFAHAEPPPAQEADPNLIVNTLPNEPPAALVPVTEATVEDDARVEQQALDILAERDYAADDESRGAAFSEALARFWEWLFRLTPEPTPPPELPPIPLPPVEAFLGVAVVLALILGITLFLSRNRTPGASPPAPPEVPKPVDPRERAAADWLADATRLRAEGQLREALRALYLATLVALDRRRVIAYSPTTTNWQYLKSIKLQGSEGQRVRAQFSLLTRTFDATWYGLEGTTLRELDEAMEVARALVERDGAEGRT